MRSLYRPALVVALLVSGIFAGTQIAGQSVPASGRPSGTFNFVSDRLFFGRSIPGGGLVPDSAWDRFLAEEVTPRFPGGLTVWRAEGQWTDRTKLLVREPVMVVEVLHPADIAADSAFEAISKTYRSRFRQEAVLRSTGPVHVQLYETAQR